MAAEASEDGRTGALKDVPADSPGPGDTNLVPGQRWGNKRCDISLGAHRRGTEDNLPVATRLQGLDPITLFGCSLVNVSVLSSACSRAHLLDNPRLSLDSEN